MMNKDEFLKLTAELTSIPGVSGNEESAARFCADILKKYTDKVQIRNGNVTADFGTRAQGKPHVLLDAHIDRVGMIAAAVEGSFVKASCVGGIDHRILPAQRVRISAKNGSICGTVCTLPPHLAKDKKVMSSDELWIDTGLTDASDIVSAGDTIDFDSPCEIIGEERLCGAGLDDRSGAAVMLAVAEQISETELPCSVTIMLSTQEEVTSRGAAIGAFDIDPDIAIEVDVSHAMCGGEDARKCSRLGEGPMIGIAPTLDRQLSDTMTDIAKDKSIPYQLEVMRGTTGTNADKFTISRKGIRSSTLSLPLRYMHTPAEIVDINDMINTVSLICGYLFQCK